MIEYLRYNRRFRRFLIKISYYVFEDAILTFLYPGDLGIEFK